MLERTHPSEAEDRKRQRILEPKSPKEDKQGSKTLQAFPTRREHREGKVIARIWAVIGLSLWLQL